MAALCLQLLASIFFTATLVVGEVKYCEKPLPNINWISTGVDITEVDLHPSDGKTPKGRKYSLVEYTCNKGKKISLDGNEYDVPDQIDRLDGTSQGSFSSKHVSTRLLETYKKSMGVEVGVGGNFPKGSFSVTGTYSNAREELTEKKRTMTAINADQTIWVVRHVVPILLAKSLSSGFATVLNKLPAKYEDDANAYVDFVRNHGTHYIKKGTFGGAYHFEFSSSEKLTTLKGETKIGIEAEAAALEILKAKGAYNRDTETVSEEFRNNTKIIQRYYGGETNLLEEDGFLKWWPTVRENPSLQNCELSPITDLVRDKKKRAEVEKAIEVYTLKQYLDKDVKKALEFYEKEDVDLDKVRAYIKEIDSVVAIKPQPSITALKEKADAIGNYTMTPEWVLNTVQLCGDFHDAGAYKCNVGGKICVRPNEPITGWFNKVQWCVANLNIDMGNDRIPAGWPRFDLQIRREERKDYVEYKYDLGSQYLWFKNLKLCFYGTSDNASNEQKENVNDRSLKRCTEYKPGWNKVHFNDMIVKSIVLQTSF